MALARSGVVLVSGELVETLKRRALTFERLARQLGGEGDYDLAMAMAEQAAQLYLKSLFHEIMGYTPRIHELRRLISILATRLEEAGFTSVAERLRDFTARRRVELVMLEDAYTMGRYGRGGYSRHTLDRALAVVRELMELVDGVRRELRRGHPND